MIKRSHHDMILFDRFPYLPTLICLFSVTFSSQKLVKFILSPL
jgi:hypothetical protein